MGDVPVSKSLVNPPSIPGINVTEIHSDFGNPIVLGVFNSFAPANHKALGARGNVCVCEVLAIGRGCGYDLG
jgi:hypothetical protein